MGDDNQAESVFERNPLSAIAKIKQDLAWRGLTGSPMIQIVITRSQAEELVAEFERLSSQVEMRDQVVQKGKRAD